MRSVDPLLQGFRRFQARYFGRRDSIFEALRHGQKPATLVIGCCDSRVHPALLTGTEPGELFVVRNVANLVPPHDPDNAHASVAAALEFAVLSLGIERIIVLGHSGCGGIRALLTRCTAPGSALTRWLDIAIPARQFVERHHAHETESVRLNLCEKGGILVSLENLLSYPWVRERVEARTLALDGWYFDLQEGALWGYDGEARRFLPLVCPLPVRSAVSLPT